MKATRVRWKIRRLGNGSYEGMVILPGSVQAVADNWLRSRKVPAHVRRRAVKRFSAGQVTRAAKGRSAGHALARAAAGAHKLLQNPLVQAAMPPGSAAAVKGLAIASKYVSAGDVASAAKKIGGPGAKRLFGAIKKLW